MLMRPAARQVGLVTLFFAIVASSRLFFVHLYGSDVPYSDQWDSDGWNWLKDYQDGRLDWGVLFLPHNEHRIALVRLIMLGLFAANDHQWDNLVESVFDVFLVAGAAALAFRVLLRQLDPPMWPLPLFVLAACCLPCGYENLLVGFQLQVYLLVGLAVWGTWLAASRDLSFGMVCLIGTVAAASLVTMASGLFAPIAIGVALGLRLWTTPASWRAYLPLTLLLIAALGIGAMLIVPVPGHTLLHAQDFADWLQALAVVASWPLPPSWFAVAIVWAPFVLGTVALLRRQDRGPASIAAAAIGVWTAMQVASIAYGRGSDIAHLHSRYTDILVFTVLVNVYFCLRLLQLPSARLNGTKRVAIAVVWLTVIVGGYAAQAAIGFVGMQLDGESRRVQAENVRRYVQEQNASALATALPWNLPYPDKDRLKMMLDDKTIRDILPPSIRPPMTIGPYLGGFSVNGLPAEVKRSAGKGAYGSFSPVTGNENLADMSSPVLHSRFHYLKFLVAGFPGGDGMSLSLDAIEDGPRRAVDPGSSQPLLWSVATAATPARDFTIHARDASKEQWLAFYSPIEVGILSRWTHLLLEASPFLLFASLLASYFLAQFRWLQRAHLRRDDRDSGVEARANSLA